MCFVRGRGERGETGGGGVKNNPHRRGAFWSQVFETAGAWAANTRAIDAASCCCPFSVLGASLLTLESFLRPVASRARALFAACR